MKRRDFIKVTGLAAAGAATMLPLCARYQLAAVGASIAPVGPALLERYFASLRLPEVVSDALAPATPNEQRVG